MGVYIALGFFVLVGVVVAVTACSKSKRSLLCALFSALVGGILLVVLKIVGFSVEFDFVSCTVALTLGAPGVLMLLAFAYLI